MTGQLPEILPGPVFISYVREDNERVDRLERELKAAGLAVWRDVNDIGAGKDWKVSIRRAIQGRSLAFVACFSRNSERRTSSYQREELIVAADEMRRRSPDEVWLIPVRFDECEIPDYDLGAGRTFNSLNRVDLFAENGYERLLGALAAQASPRIDGRLGRPIRRCDPFDLSVRRPLEPSGEAVTPPVLPIYVPRAHDARLADLVEAAVGGRSGMAVLVGDPSTGKTRACWEAVATLSEQWWVWHPVDPSYSEAAMAGLADVGPHTVVWLDDAQHYLLTQVPSVGESVAARIRTLLRDPGRAPVLVLATMWRNFWGTATRHPQDASDLHAHVRNLFEHAVTTIPVPDAFTPADLVVLHRVAVGDPMLARAAQLAESGRVTQCLAGVPELLKRYENASVVARAVIDAAIDARRLGHSLPVPRALLEHAVPGLLRAEEWRREGGPGWLDRGLQPAGEECHGTPGPLTWIRPLPGAGETVPLYRVADSLEQHGSEQRRHHVPGAAFWDAAVDHVRTDDDRCALAVSAVNRGRYRHAAQLFGRAAANGDAEAMVGMARLLERAGRADEARAWWWHAADAGHPQAMTLVGAMLDRQGRADEALSWWRVAADAGDEQASVRVAYLLDAIGRGEEARGWWERAEEATAGYANRTMMNVLLAEGRCDEALAWTTRPCGCSRGGSWRSSWRWDDMARLLHRQGRIDESIAFWKRAVRVDTDPDDGVYGDWLREAADVMVGAGRADDAVEWLRDYADHGDPVAPRQLVDRLVALGRLDEAVAWLKARAGQGHKGAAQQVADLLEKAGHGVEALVWLQERAARGDVAALSRAVRTLQVQGRSGEAHAWLASDWEDASVPVTTLLRMAELLRAGGEDALALLHVREAVDHPGFSDPLSWVARHASQHADTPPPEAVREWERAVGSRDSAAMLAAAAVLEVTGSHGEALEQTQTIVESRRPSRADEASRIDSWLRAGSADPDPTVLRRRCAMAAEAGWPEKATRWLRHRADRGDDLARSSLVALLVDHDRVDEALRYLMAAAAADRGYAAAELIALLIADGRVDDAVQRLRDTNRSHEIPRVYAEAGRIAEATTEWRWAADGGNNYALESIVALLRDNGDDVDAGRLERYGWEPDGTVAAPWDPAHPARHRPATEL